MFRVNFENAHPVRPIGIDILGHTTSYFLGDDPSRWVSAAGSYERIRYQNLYDNIDLEYRGSPQGIKYEFRVHPGGNPSEIKLSYDGAQLNILKGQMVIKVGSTFIKDDQFYTYIERDDAQAPVDAKMTVKGNTVQFQVDYIGEDTLVIDPLIHSTYLGGAECDGAFDTVYDGYGNIYVTGYTTSSDFPNTTGGLDGTWEGYQDVFVAKLDNECQNLIYSTYIGQKYGDVGFGIAVDNACRAYVTGKTWSYFSGSSFPTTVGAYDTSYNGGYWGDAFALKLNETGTGLMYSTFLGGDGEDTGCGISVHDEAAYITGMTYESSTAPFPTTSGAYDTIPNGGYFDAFALELNTNGSDLVFSTFLGGSDWDTGTDIAVDWQHSIYITGTTQSSDFPTSFSAFCATYNGNRDIFALKLNATGSILLYSTYIGGNGDDGGDFNFYAHEYDVGLMEDGYCAYIAGYTNSSDFPTTPDAHDTTFNGNGDAFLLELNTDGTGLNFSTFYGSSGHERSNDITWDYHGGFYIAGTTDSSDLPVTLESYDTTFNGLTDCFIAVFNWTGGLQYATYIGGSGDDQAYAITKAVINHGVDNSFHLVGNLTSSDFSNATDGYDPTFNGASDAFALKLHVGNRPSAPVIRAELVEHADNNEEPSVSVYWSNPDNGGFYPIYYSLFKGHNETSLNWVLNLSDQGWLDIDAKDNVTYYYAVSATNEVGDGPLSNIVNITADTFPPNMTFISPSEGAYISGNYTFKVLIKDTSALVLYQSNYFPSPGINVSGTCKWIQYDANSGYYENDFDTTSLADGKQNVKAHSEDVTHRWSNIGPINITIDNTPPKIVSVSIPDCSTINGTVIVTANTTDVSPVDIDYRVDDGSWVNSSEPLDTTHLQEGPHVIEVKATDRTNHTTVISINVTVSGNPTGNHKPTAKLIGPANNSVVRAGDVKLDWSVNDTDGDTVLSRLYLCGSWFEAGSLPPYVANTNFTVFNASSYPANATYYWVVRPNDGTADGQLTEIWRFTIEARPNQSPLFKSVPPVQATVNKTYVYDVSVEDPDNDVLTCTLDARPYGMTLGNITSAGKCIELLWVPVRAQKGDHNVLITVSDGKGGQAHQTFTIHVGVIRPVCAIQYPVEGLKMSGKKYASGSSLIGTDAVVGVQVRVDHGQWTNASGTLTWNSLVDTTKLKKGNHTLEARAFDGEEYSDIASVMFTVDGSSPLDLTDISDQFPWWVIPVAITGTALILISHMQNKGKNRPIRRSGR